MLECNVLLPIQGFSLLLATINNSLNVPILVFGVEEGVCKDNFLFIHARHNNPLLRVNHASVLQLGVQNIQLLEED